MFRLGRFAESLSSRPQNTPVSTRVDAKNKKDLLPYAFMCRPDFCVPYAIKSPEVLAEYQKYDDKHQYKQAGLALPH